MIGKPSSEFDNFRILFRKVISVSQGSNLMEQEKEDKKSAPKKQPNKVKP